MIVSPNMNSKLTKLGFKRIKINEDALNRDLQTVELLLKNCRSRERRDELKEMARVLKTASSNCRMGAIPILWYSSQKGAYSYPVELRNFENDGIDCATYIEKPLNSSVARISFRDAINIMLFEMMHRDLGFSHNDMEDELKDYGIITSNKADKLLSLINDLGEEPFELSKFYKIGQSIYYDADDKVMYDYFQNMPIETVYYRQPALISCNCAMSMILDELLDKFKTKNVLFTLCAMDERSITFIIDNNSIDKVKSIIQEPVTVRVFGRMFDTFATLDIIEGTEENDEEQDV